MLASNVHVRVSLDVDEIDHSTNLIITPNRPLFGHVTDHSPLTLHNDTAHPILIWASANEQGGTNESSDHIGGWQALVEDGGELPLIAGQEITNGHLTIIEHHNSFWIHAKIKTGGLGGGLSASVEIEVTPP
jgi:hypothetical protein